MIPHNRLNEQSGDGFLQTYASSFLAAVFAETEDELMLIGPDNRILAAVGKNRETDGGSCAIGDFYTPGPNDSAKKCPVSGPNGERLGYLIVPNIPANRLDPLTQLADRRCFETEYERFAQKRDQSGEPLTLSFLDLDQFKPVNDTYGHWAGDQVLVQFASRLRKQFRSPDTAARYGGDEFAVLFPGCPQKTAEKQMIGLRDQLTAAPVTIRISNAGEKAEKIQEIPLSFSFGVISTLPNETFADAVRRADAELYRMKNKRLHPRTA